MCRQQCDLIYFYLVSYCQPNKAGLSCSLKRWRQTLKFISCHNTWKSSFRMCIEGVGRDIRDLYWLAQCYTLKYIRRISSYIKIHLHLSKDVRHINTIINICHTHFLSQKNSRWNSQGSHRPRESSVSRQNTLGFFLRCKFRADQLLCWYVFTLNLTVCKSNMDVCSIFF